MTEKLIFGDRVEVALPTGEKIKGRIRGMRKVESQEGPIYDIDYYEDGEMRIMMCVALKNIIKYK